MQIEPTDSFSSASDPLSKQHRDHRLLLRANGFHAEWLFRTAAKADPRRSSRGGVLNPLNAAARPSHEAVRKRIGGTFVPRQVRYFSPIRSSRAPTSHAF